MVRQERSTAPFPRLERSLEEECCRVMTVGKLTYDPLTVPENPLQFQMRLP